MKIQVFFMHHLRLRKLTAMCWTSSVRSVWSGSDVKASMACTTIKREQRNNMKKRRRRKMNIILRYGFADLHYSDRTEMSS